MNKKKLIFIDSYVGSLYGAQKSMLHLAKLLDGKDYQVSIGSIAESETLLEAKKNNLECDPILLLSSSLKPIGNSNIFNKVKILILAIFNWIYLFKNFSKLKQYDYVCFNDIRLFVYLFPILPLIRNKLVWYVRIKERNIRLNDFFSRFCKSIAFVSSDCEESFRSIKCENVFVVNTGFDTVNLMPKQLSSKLVINTVGSLCERKNQLQILEILDEVSLKGFNDFELNIIGGEVGNSLYKEKLASYVSNSKLLKGKVNFLGFRKDIFELLNSGDIFFFSSKREGLPRSVIEALKMGNFVISSEVEGINDIITDKYLGYIYKADSCTVASDVLSTMQNISNFSLSAKNYRSKYANMKFSNDSFVEEFEKCLI
ncbi:hypothetical protein C9I98_11240 [Photobacterium sanctipauli]|uniref:Glycosyl transferase family 1 domain-containing protein n=2 Tax=Photobacterium sanctipauli TaxID=1342794 RepID=A0A2T3NT79_9GAMM|nr:glycosyltransferase [Photobacterium sanctipauli]PSW19486.1 hypothetical protein C9I98_11240 [Photobacterium sanctipauli]